MVMPSDTVTLQVAGQNLAGWQDVRIVRGIELFPSYFSLRLTERFPAAPKTISVDPGQTFKLMVGSDLVMTGYIDSYEGRISSKGHEISVIGRSATQDLVDCAAGIYPDGSSVQPGMTFAAPTLLQLAQDLCKPFGISVTEPDGEGAPLISYGTGVPAFTMPLGASVYDYLEPKIRLRQMLMLDGSDGNLILAKVGVRKAGSGFSLPGNVIEAGVRLSKQDRFSVYLPVAHAFDDFRSAASVFGRDSSNPYAPVPDPAAFRGQSRQDGEDRFRPLFVISDQPFPGSSLAEQLAKWEMGRRYGRSQAVTALVSLWRDSTGALWTPNTLAPVDMPALKLAGRTWLISQVAFLKGERGTQSLVTLMPPEAFLTEPKYDTSFDPSITQALTDTFSQGAPATRDGRRDQG